MRKQYHVIINNEDDVVQYSHVLQRLGLDAGFACSERQFTDNKFKHESIVELSKYELLYLRLSVKTGNIKEIPSNETFLYTSTGLHP